MKVEQEDAPKLKIPAGVSPHLTQELEAIQAQIRILWRNYKIVFPRYRKDPENEQHQFAVYHVERYLCQFQAKQEPILKKIREEISALKTSEKSADVKPDPGEVDECPKIKEEPVEEIEQNTEPSETSHDVESPAVKDEGQTAKSETSSTPPEKPKPAKKPINFKERMAAVREKKKKKPKRGRGANPYAAPKPTRTPTPDDDDDDEDDWTKFTDPEQDLQPGQFRAHIAEVERMSFDNSALREAASGPLVNPIQLKDTKYEVAEKTNYLHHLGLFTPAENDMKLAQQRSDRKRKFDYRNVTFIPEFTEKKQRFNYAWLGAEQAVSSPPLLRTRRRAPNPLTNPDLIGVRRRAKRSVTATAATTPKTATSTRTNSPAQTPAVSRMTTPEAEEKPKEMVHVQDPHLLENPAQDEVYEELEETTVDPHQNFPDAVKEELKTELPMDEDEESSVDGSSGSISNPFDFGEKKEDVSSNETEDVKLEADEEEPLAAANMPAADKNISPSLPEEAKSSTAAAENVVDEFKSSEVVPEVTEISTENVDQEDNLDTRSEASSTLLTSGEAITESDGKDIGNANAPTVSQTTQPIQTALEEDSPSPDSPVPVTTTELMASSVPESSGTEALSKESTPNQVRESKRASVRDRQKAKIQKKTSGLEDELVRLMEKSEELRVQIEGNGLTVATRKERMRKSELSQDRTALEKRIAVIREKLSKYTEEDK